MARYSLTAAGVLRTPGAGRTRRSYARLLAGLGSSAPRTDATARSWPGLPVRAFTTIVSESARLGAAASSWSEYRQVSRVFVFAQCGSTHRVEQPDVDLGLPAGQTVATVSLGAVTRVGFESPPWVATVTAEPTAVLGPWFVTVTVK